MKKVNSVQSFFQIVRDIHDILKNRILFIPGNQLFCKIDMSGYNLFKKDHIFIIPVRSEFAYMFKLISNSLEGRYNDQAWRILRFNYFFNSSYSFRRSDRCTAKLQNFHYVKLYKMKMHLNRCTKISRKNSKNKVKWRNELKILNIYGIIV